MNGTSQRRDHDRRRDRRPAWVRSWERVHYALNASARLINASITVACRSERHLQRRPMHSSRDLIKTGSRLVVASARLERAALALKQATEAIGREPETAAGAPAAIIEATERWVVVAQTLAEVSNDVFSLHQNVVDGLESGHLVPEQPRPRFPRIVLTPRPAPVRAFLRVRLTRATDRISAVVQRRRRTPRPAALRVPRRTSQGRAPPFSSIQTSLVHPIE